MSAIGDGLPKVVTTSATPQDLVSGLAQANLSTEQLVSGGNWKLCLPLFVTWFIASKWLFPVQHSSTRELKLSEIHFGFLEMLKAELHMAT